MSIRVTTLDTSHDLVSAPAHALPRASSGLTRRARRPAHPTASWLLQPPAARQPLAPWPLREASIGRLVHILVEAISTGDVVSHGVCACACAREEKPGRARKQPHSRASLTSMSRHKKRRLIVAFSSCARRDRTCKRARADLHGVHTRRESSAHDGQPSCASSRRARGDTTPPTATELTLLIADARSSKRLPASRVDNTQLSIADRRCSEQQTSPSLPR